MTPAAILAALDEAERGPAPGDLDAAPMLSQWWLGESDFSIIVAKGDVSGHPDITDPFVTTSPVLGFDVAGGWMRTRSRWYRLNPPAGLPKIDEALAAAQKLLAVDRAIWRKNAESADTAEM